jgi:poly [ADP-ribose] polymerase
MAHLIEAAKTGRASCRTCKKPIAKGELRFGEEVPNQFDAGKMTHVWHHLECAAKKRPSPLKAALESTTTPVPNQGALLALIAEHQKAEKPSTLPYAERAPTGRSSCIECHEAIAKGELRVAVERTVETGSFVTQGAGYLHAACALRHVGDELVPFFQKLTDHSPGLDAADLDALKAGLAS